MNTQQFTTKLYKALNNDLTLRPYNRFEPSDTLWWLVPSTDWPAFKYGKYFVNHTKAFDHFEVGLYIEKGHGSVILAANGDIASNCAQVMDNSWGWVSLTGESLDELSMGLDMIQKAGLNPKVRLEVEPYFTERGDPGSAEILHSFDLSYNWSDGLCQRIDTGITTDNNDIEAFIRTLPQQVSLKELVHAANKINSGEWYWMNLLLYVETDNPAIQVVDGLSSLASWVK